MVFFYPPYDGLKKRPCFRRVFLYLLARFKKTAQLSLSCFYTPLRGLKKAPAFAESFYTPLCGLLGVKKENHSFEWSSYTPKRF